ncbi:MAG TPA: hypothetical protein VF783_00905 [Terriglobales bacterium]
MLGFERRFRVLIRCYGALDPSLPATTDPDIPALTNVVERCSEFEESFAGCADKLGKIFPSVIPHDVYSIFWPLLNTLMQMLLAASKSMTQRVARLLSRAR